MDNTQSASSKALSSNLDDPSYQNFVALSQQDELENIKYPPPTVRNNGPGSSIPKHNGDPASSSNEIDWRHHISQPPADSRYSSHQRRPRLKNLLQGGQPGDSFESSTSYKRTGSPTPEDTDWSASASPKKRRRIDGIKSYTVVENDPVSINSHQPPGRLDRQLEFVDSYGAGLQDATYTRPTLLPRTPSALFLPPLGSLRPSRALAGVGGTIREHGPDLAPLQLSPALGSAPPTPAVAAPSRLLSHQQQHAALTGGANDRRASMEEDTAAPTTASLSRQYYHHHHLPAGSVRVDHHQQQNRSSGRCRSPPAVTTPLTPLETAGRWGILDDGLTYGLWPPGSEREEEEAGEGAPGSEAEKDGRQRDGGGSRRRSSSPGRS